MTEKSPEVLATADLSPVSPAPLHLSSPVVVPSLQDQADSLSNMSLEENGEPPTASGVAVEQTETTDLNTNSTANSQYDANNTNTVTSYQADFDSLDDGVKGQENRAALVGGEGHIEQQPSQHNDGDVSKHDTPAISSDVSDPLTNQSEVIIPDISFATHAQSVHQPAPIQDAADVYLPAPQGLAVVSSSTDTSAPQPSTAPPAGKSDNAKNDIDIQSLVDRIIGDASTTTASQAPGPDNFASIPAPAQTGSLPPRPPMSQPTYVRPEDGLGYLPGLSYPTPYNLPPAPGTYPAGAPGTAPDTRNNFPLPPSSSLNALPASTFPISHYDSTYAATAGAQAPTFNQSQQWETFLQDERRYVSEAKWDRFPEGSRLFIGMFVGTRYPSNC